MTCTCRKAIFMSRAEAVMQSRVAGRGHPYVCPCDPGLWHLTSMDARARRAERRRRRAMAR